MKIFLTAASLLFALPVLANPFIIKKDHHFLKIEVLKNRGLHFEVMKKKKAADRIWTTPMVLKSYLALDKSATQNGNIISNKNFKVTVHTDNFCISTYDKVQKINLNTVCPYKTNQAWKGLSIISPTTENLYGLGQYFTNPGTADGDLVGRVWDPGLQGHGNALRTFSKGANSYAMFPVVYSMGEKNQNYFFFYDNVYKQMWTLNKTPFGVESYGDAQRWFIFSSNNIKNLRRAYMGLTGKAPVPSKNVFGLWISEFGYDSWDELQGEVDDLRAKGFPLDGAALDLQWFGGEFYQGDVDRSGSQFGSLSFDLKNFPNPKVTIADFKNRQGISLMPIEESYISKWLPEHKDLASRGFMAKWCGTNSPTELNANPWWGIGGMVDWTNDAAGDYWHDLKRKKLNDLGLYHHWTDLGEPEMYHDNSCYYGFPELRKHNHGDVHNIYNFKWLESIARGYERNKESIRPFIMSRSGTAGIQRFGASVWSGDIGANMNAMTTHYNAQMHMTFSGIDYYGADIGGFHRSSYTLDGDANELFTQWFANAAVFDFPVRSHTWNTQNDRVTSPSKIGHTESNLANTKLRYKFSPYYYSLAHEAYLTGDSIVVPMPIAFPTDLNVRQMGNQKMVGPYLMGAMVARYGEWQRNVYLPEGTWINFHTGDFYISRGQYFYNFKTWHDGKFQIPLLVKAGAIIPRMKVDKQTMNISGKRKDGTTDTSLGLLIAPSEKSSSFTLYEDDGQTVNYKKNAVAKTKITQVRTNKGVEIIISKTLGSYAGVVYSRDINLVIYTNKITKATFNGTEVKFKKIGNNKYEIKVTKADFTKENVFNVN